MCWNFIALWYSIAEILHILKNPLWLMDICFLPYLLAVANSAAVKILVLVFVWTTPYSSVGVKLLGCMVIFCLIYKGTSRPFSLAVMPLHLPQWKLTPHFDKVLGHGGTLRIAGEQSFGTEAAVWRLEGLQALLLPWCAVILGSIVYPIWLNQHSLPVCLPPSISLTLHFTVPVSQGVLHPDLT